MLDDSSSVPGGGSVGPKDGDLRYQFSATEVSVLRSGRGSLRGIFHPEGSSMTARAEANLNPSAMLGYGV